VSRKRQERRKSSLDCVKRDKTKEEEEREEDTGGEEEKVEAKAGEE